MKELLHFEDFAEGQKFALGPYEITASEIVEFAREFDPQPFHLEDYARQSSVLGGLSASGWHTLALTVRLMCDACLSRSTILGSRGFEKVKWLNPVRPGDVLQGTFEIRTARRSGSKAGVGILTFLSYLQSQSGEPKTEVEGMFFMRARSA